MARPKSEKSKTVIAFDDAKKAFDHATEQLSKNENATTKKAHEGAQKRYDDAKNAVKRERFVNVTGGRAAKTLATIENLAKGFSPATYSYSKDEAGEVVDAIMTAAKNLQDRVSTILAGKTETKAEKKAFSFQK